MEFSFWLLFAKFHGGLFYLIPGRCHYLAPKSLDMKKMLLFLLFSAIHLAAFSQCSTVSIEVSASDTSYVQLYHAGIFLIPSGNDNICDWEVRSFTDELIFETTTSGDFEGQSFAYFEHAVPITDSMKVTLQITNPTEGITCTMQDTLFWEEMEILPGSFIGDWAILSDNGGIEEEITATINLKEPATKLRLFPTPTADYFQVASSLPVHTLDIFNVHGQLMQSFQGHAAQTPIDVSALIPGCYFVQCFGQNNQFLGVQTLIKQ